MHAHAEQAKAELTQVSARLQSWVKGTAEQFKTQAACTVGDHLNHTLLRRLAHGVSGER